MPSQYYIVAVVQQAEWLHTNSGVDSSSRFHTQNVSKILPCIYNKVQDLMMMMAVKNLSTVGQLMAMFLYHVEDTLVKDRVAITSHNP